METKRLLAIGCTLILLTTGVLWAQEMPTEGPSSVATIEAEPLEGRPPGSESLPGRGADIRTTFSGSVQNETSIAGDPRNNSILIGGMNDFGVLGTNRAGNGVVFSGDGGVTWTHHATGIPLPANFTHRGGDPSIAFDSGGLAYYAHIASAAGASIHTRNNGVFVSSSATGGATWAPTVPVAVNMWPGFGTVPFEDKEMVAADEYPGSPNTDNVYLRAYPRNL